MKLQSQFKMIGAVAQGQQITALGNGWMLRCMVSEHWPAEARYRW